jgi:hypothetical protein
MQRDLFGLSDRDQEQINQFLEEEKLIEYIGDPVAREQYWKEVVSPNLDCHFVRRSNPLLSAHLRLSLLVVLEDFNLSFCNAHVRITPMSHLYQGMKLNGVLTSEWDAMEQLSMHHCKELFLGKVPTTPHESLTRASLYGGMSVLRVAHSTKHRSGGPEFRGDSAVRQLKDRKTWDLLPSPISGPLLDYYEGKSTPETLIAALDELMQRRKDKIAVKKLAKYVDKNLDNGRLIIGLCNFLPPLFERMSPDLLTLTRTCSTLFKSNNDVHGHSMDSPPLPTTNRRFRNGIRSPSPSEYVKDFTVGVKAQRPLDLLIVSSRCPTLHPR